MIARLRYQLGWRQDDLVAKMQIHGCYMTRDILASIETRRCPATDTQIKFFSEVLRVKVQDLFPASPSDGQPRQANPDAFRIVTRQREKPAHPAPG